MTEQLLTDSVFCKKALPQILGRILVRFSFFLFSPLSQRYCIYDCTVFGAICLVGKAVSIVIVMQRYVNRLSCIFMRQNCIYKESIPSLGFIKCDIY